MDLQKAFDPQALVKALEAKGIADAEQLVNDELPMIFEWLNKSVSMVTPAPYGMIVTTVLVELEAKATDAIKALEAKIG